MKQKLRLLFVFFLITFSVSVLGQTSLLPNEVSLFSFKTDNDKIVLLAKDKNNGYIIYRFGTTTKVEFEYPNKTKNSWSQFKYYYYSRGGGKQNDAVNIAHVSFINGDYEYMLYDDYSSENDEFSIGVLVTHLKSGKLTDIKGKLKKKKGFLCNFKGSELLEVKEDY